MPAPDENPRGPRLWPLFAGGFLGPFGGGLVTPMLPELASALHTSLATAAASLTAYMIPFAGIMVVSGTFGERWGRARTVQVAYLAYALASLLCALAPNAPLFLTGRACQGAANAFTSPLLVAAISDLMPRSELGRALGRFGGWQAAGQAFAPLVGGVSASVDYRLAFLASVVAAAVLAAVPPSDPPPDPIHHVSATASRWRVLLNPRLARSCALAFGLYLSTSGLTLLAALLSGDAFGLGPDTRGLVVAAFGVAGLATGARFGRLADGVGVRAFGIAALSVLGAAVALTGIAPDVALLVAAVAAGGAASTAGRVVTNTLAVTSTPANRGGATSMTLAWQFLGSAIAPLTLLPVYHAHAALGFLAASTGAFGGAVLLALSGRLSVEAPHPSGLETPPPSAVEALHPSDADRQGLVRAADLAPRDAAPPAREA